MANYTIEIPDEVETFVKKVLGYDMGSYIDMMLVRPMMDHFKAKEEKAQIELVKPQIDEKVESAREKIKIEKSKKQMDKVGENP